MAMWIWVIFLSCIVIFGLVFIVLNQATEEVMIPELRDTLTNSTNVQAFDYIRTIWIFLPFIFLVAMTLWSINQAQKRKYYYG